MVAGNQESERPLRYLLDCLYEALGAKRKWGTESDPVD